MTEPIGMGEERGVARWEVASAKTMTEEARAVVVGPADVGPFDAGAIRGLASVRAVDLRVKTR